MTYLDGGQSALGEFWAPFKTGLEGINETLAAFKEVFAAFWAENGETVTAFGNDLFTIIGASVMQLVAIFQMFFASESAINILNDLLQYEHMEAGTFTLDLERLTLIGLLQEKLGWASLLAVQKAV
eukprot:gene1817-2267_t